MALRDLFVRLGIEVGGAEKLAAVDAKARAVVTSLRGVSRAADSAAASTKRMGAGMGGNGLMKTIVSATTIYGLIRLGRGISNFVQQQIDAAVRLDVMAEKLGISTKELKLYQFMADKSKISFVELTTAFRFFNRATGEVALGTKGTSKIFHQMGLSVRDAHGKIKPTDELLFEFADKLAAIPDQATRTAFAMRALGRGGSALLPILQHGSVELRKQFALYATFTGGPSERMIRMSKEVWEKINLQRLGVKALSSAVMENLLPALIKWQNRSLENMKWMLNWVKTTTTLTTALLFLGGAGTILALSRLAMAIRATFALKNFGQAALVMAGIAAAVAVLYWAFDDVYGLLTGVDSTTGHWLETLYGVEGKEKLVDNLKKSFEALATAILGDSTTFDTLKQDLADFLADELPTIIRAVIISFLNFAMAVNLVYAGLKTVYDMIRMIGGSVGFVLNLPNTIRNKLIGGGDAIGDAESAMVSNAGADVLRTNEQWEKMQALLDRAAGATAAAFPDMPRGTTRKQRENRIASETGGFEDTNAGVSREVRDLSEVPNAGRVNGGTQTTHVTDNRQTTIHVAVTQAPGAAPLNPVQIAEAVRKAQIAEQQATYNQAFSSQPDNLFSPAP